MIHTLNGAGECPHPRRAQTILGAFMSDLEDVIERVCNGATSSRFHTFAVITSDSAKKVTDPNAEFCVKKDLQGNAPAQQR